MAGKPPMHIDEMELYRSRLKAKQAAVEQAEGKEDTDNERSLERPSGSKDVGIEFKTALRLNRVRAGSEADDGASEGKNCKKAMNALHNYCVATFETIMQPELSDHFQGDDLKKIQKAVDETTDWLGGSEAGRTTAEYKTAYFDLSCIVQPILMAVCIQACCWHAQALSPRERRT